MSILVSCFSNSYGRFGVRGAIENLRRAGLDHLELPIRTAGVSSLFGDEPMLTPQSTADDLKRLDALLAEHGVRVSSCNVTSGNPLERSVVELTKRKLDVAARFDVQTVVGGAGAIPDERSRDVLYGHLTELGDRARDLGIVYCCETHPGICVNHSGMLQHDARSESSARATQFRYRKHRLLQRKRERRHRVGEGLPSRSARPLKGCRRRGRRVELSRAGTRRRRRFRQRTTHVARLRILRPVQPGDRRG